MDNLKKYAGLIFWGVLGFSIIIMGVGGDDNFSLYVFIYFILLILWKVAQREWGKHEGGAKKDKGKLRKYAGFAGWGILGGGLG